MRENVKRMEARREQEVSGSYKHQKKEFSLRQV